MSKDLLFRVELTFENKIVSDEEVMEVAQRIANALENEANTAGLAPEQGDNFTAHIRVTPWYINESIIISL